jgi:hypothetical protein
MDYAALIDKLQSLPKDKQGTVFDFVEFFFSRYQSELGQDKTLAQSSLTYSITNPQVVADFTPLSRDEANGG